MGCMAKQKQKQERVARSEVEVWSSGLMWVEAAEMQCARFRRVSAFNTIARVEAGSRSLAAVRPELREGRNRPVLVPTVALHMQQRIERTFLLSAINNVFRAQDRLPEKPKTAMKEESVLKDLRNISEHWDEYGRSAKNLMETEHAKEFFGIQEKLATMRGPEELERFRKLAADDLWAVFELPMPDNNEVWLSGIPLTRIHVWLIEVRQCLERALRAEGEDVPEMMDSNVDGDDETPWPEERTRYRLWREDMRHVPEMGLQYMVGNHEGQVDGALSEDEQRVEVIMAAMAPVVDDLLAAHFAQQEADEKQQAENRNPGP